MFDVVPFFGRMLPCDMEGRCIIRLQGHDIISTKNGIGDLSGPNNDTANAQDGVKFSKRHSILSIRYNNNTSP